MNVFAFLYELLKSASQFVAGKTAQKFEVFNPFTDEEICEVDEALEEDVDSAVEAAQRAFPSWSSISALERAAPLAKFAQLINQSPILRKESFHFTGCTSELRLEHCDSYSRASTKRTLQVEPAMMFMFISLSTSS